MGRIWSCALTFTYLSSCLRGIRRGCDTWVRKVMFRTPRRRLGRAGTSFVRPRQVSVLSRPTPPSTPYLRMFPPCVPLPLPLPLLLPLPLPLLLPLPLPLPNPPPSPPSPPPTHFTSSMTHLQISPSSFRRPCTLCLRGFQSPNLLHHEHALLPQQGGTRQRSSPVWMGLLELASPQALYPVPPPDVVLSGVTTPSPPSTLTFLELCPSNPN